MKYIPAKLTMLIATICASVVLATPAARANAMQGRDDEDCYSRSYVYIGAGGIPDKPLGHTVVYENVPQKSISSNEGFWQAYPCHSKLQFSGYPYPSSFGLGPTIYFYPVRDSYQSLYPSGTEDFWLAEVESLRTTLRDRPIWQAPTFKTGEQPLRPPLLPIVNSATIYLARQQYIDFPAGSGVSYIGYVTQQPSPPDKNDTFYIFQGITDKDSAGHQFYISAIFPAFLASPPFLIDDFDPFANVRRVIDALAEANSSDFNPDLRILDNLVASFDHTYPPPMLDGGVLSGMPDAGMDSTGRTTTLLTIVSLLMLLVGTILRSHMHSRIKRFR